MRATSNPPTPAQNADAVWDEVHTGHTTINTFGNKLYYNAAWLDLMRVDYARRTAYTYGPTNLAAGATYVPTAGTVITCAVLDGVDDNDFRIVHGTIVVGQIGRITDTFEQYGFVGMLYCDGTNVGIKNADAAGRDLSIEGFTP